MLVTRHRRIGEGHRRAVGDIVMGSHPAIGDIIGRVMDAYANGDTYPHANGHADANTYRDAHGYTHSHANGNANCHTDADRNANSNTDRDPDCDAHTVQL